MHQVVFESVCTLFRVRLLESLREVSFFRCSFVVCPRRFIFMHQVVFESVRKIFRHRPALFNWLGRERGGETIALKNISFSAGSAEVLALLGPNGSGKTTGLRS